MNQVLRLIHNKQTMRTALALADQFVISGTRFATSWMLARFCGAEQLGYYALGFSVLVVVDLLLQAFVTAPYSIFSQKTTKYRLPQYTGDALAQAGMVGALGVLVFLIIGFAVAVGNAPTLASVMFVLAATVPLCIVREFGRRHCFASERFGLALSFDSLFSIVQLGTMYALLNFASLSSITAHASGGLACAVALSIWFLACRGDIQFGSRYWRLHLRRHWKFGRWVFASQTLNQLNWNVVQWIIAYRLSTEATGVFTGCLTIAFLSNPFVLGIANIIYPRLALVQANQGHQAMRRLALKSTAAIGFVMTCFTLVLLLAGRHVCDFLYADPAYTVASLVPAILAAAVSCLAITMPFDGCLWAEKRTALSSAASGVGLVVTAFAVLALVSWGTTAASMGLLIGCVTEAGSRIVFFTLSCKLFDRSSTLPVYAS